MQYRSTGEVSYACACGYASGWVAADSIDSGTLRLQHPTGQPAPYRIVPGEVLASTPQERP
ncbi:MULTISPECIES: hypothetical protein [Streptomyces]|nr:hypothetical protein [Streptomyces venezuelae]